MITKLRTIFFLAVVFLGIGYSTAPQAAPLTPSVVNADPARYSGTTIVVQGFLKLSPEGHTLYESQKLDTEFRNGWRSGNPDFDPTDYKKYCLTVANPDELYKYGDKLSGKTVRIKGKFLANYMDGKSIDLGACPLPTAIVIDPTYLRRRYGSPTSPR